MGGSTGTSGLLASVVGGTGAVVGTVVVGGTGIVVGGTGTVVPGATGTVVVQLGTLVVGAVGKVVGGTKGGVEDVGAEEPTVVTVVMVLPKVVPAVPEGLDVAGLCVRTQATVHATRNKTPNSAIHFFIRLPPIYEMGIWAHYIIE